MQDPTTTTSNFPRSPAILILKEATNRKRHKSHKRFTGNGRGNKVITIFRSSYMTILLLFNPLTYCLWSHELPCFAGGRWYCEGLFSTFSMKWIENNAFIWRYWTWEWETCRCYRHRSSLHKVRWFWYRKGSSSVKCSRFQGIKPEVYCTVFWVENSFLGVVSL